jgi:hypothetical protein
MRGELLPRQRTWRGASWGGGAATTVALITLGSMLRTGRGLVLDGLLAIAIGWVAIGVIAGAILIVGRTVRAVPVRLRAAGFAAVLFVGYWLASGPISPGGVFVAAVFIGGGALVGAGFVSVRGSSGPQHAIAGTGLALGVLAVVGSVVWLAWGAGAPESHELSPTGSYAVATFTYGSGQHRHRPEFGAAVDVVTPTVDGSVFLEGWAGWRGGMRSSYWGFGPDRLPLNARVWHPVGAEAGPLVLIVHGNSAMEVPSDAGYGWLGEDLASRGYVVASVDQNFLNGSVTRGQGLPGDVDARAWLLLEHLRLWRDTGAEPDSPLHGLADLERIALIGHSRGGEAVADAAHFDQLVLYPDDGRVVFEAGFGIDTVIAIAPNDNQYLPAGRPTQLRDVSYLTIHGGRDSDNLSFVGLRQYARTTFTGTRFAVKAAVFLEDANHGQFNTMWGRRDVAGIAGRTLDLTGVMPSEAQRRDARTAIAAMLDATLRDDRGALGVLRDPAHRDWTDATRVITRYEDSTEIVIAGFAEDADPSTGTLPGVVISGDGLASWKEGPAALRWGGEDTRGVDLGWDNQHSDAPAVFAISLPGDVAAPPEPVLAIDIADLLGHGAGGDNAGTPDFTVEVITSRGLLIRTTVDEHGGVPAAARPRRLKPPLPDVLAPSEPVAQTLLIPLGQLDEDDVPREVRFVFDRTPTGDIRIERIAIAGAAPSRST